MRESEGGRPIDRGEVAGVIALLLPLQDLVVPADHLAPPLLQLRLRVVDLGVRQVLRSTRVCVCVCVCVCVRACERASVRCEYACALCVRV